MCEGRREREGEENNIWVGVAACLHLDCFPCVYFLGVNQYDLASTSGEWVKTLQTVCGPTMIKHMRSIKSALVNIVDSCTFKVTADGPLNLRDMQQLASTQSKL